MIFVPTRDRPSALALALRSHGAARTRAEHAVPVVVVDDSTDEQATRAVCEKAGAVHVGLAERTRLVDSLATCKEEREALSFALLPSPRRTTTCVGASRNTIALLAAGSPFVSLDDDTSGAFFRPKQAERGKSVADPHPNEIVSLADVTSVRTEAWTALTQSLGGTLLLRDARTPTPVRMRIAMTLLGAAGDLGVGTAGQLLFNSDASQARIAAGLLDHVLAGGPAARVATSAQPSVVPFCMMTGFGADARALLPPVLPLGRAQDGLFAWTLRAVDPDACFLHLPLAVAHRQGGARRFDLAGLHAFGDAPRLVDVVRLAITEHRGRLPGTTVAERMEALGAALDTRLTSLADLETGWNAQRAAWGRCLHESAQSCPPGAMRAASVALASRLTSKRVTLAAHAEGRPIVDCVRRFGRLLAAWPTLWARMVDVHASRRSAVA